MSYSPIRRSFATVISPLLMTAGMVGLGQPATGADFRIDNEVYSAGRKTPDSRSVTIFHEGLIYDFLEEPAEVIVLDPSGGRFVLLAPSRRVRSELTTAKVLSFSQQLQQRAAAQDDPYLQFLAAPRFEERFDPDEKELTLSSTWMTYRLVLGDTSDAAMARQVRTFSDWYARLNAMLNPGSKPPLARLEVNAAMGRQDAIARVVHLTTRTTSGSDTTIRVRSEHRLARSLTKDDKERVAEAQRMMSSLKSVEFDQYRRGE